MSIYVNTELFMKAVILPGSKKIVSTIIYAIYLKTFPFPASIFEHRQIEEDPVARLFRTGYPPNHETLVALRGRRSNFRGRKANPGQALRKRCCTPREERAPGGPA